MAALHEIILPETKPETEWILGRPVRKVSPKRRHARLQTAFARALEDWAGASGEVAVEWRFRVTPPGQIRRPLVPDVAFVRNERLRGLEGEDLEVPPLAPDVVVEILSPNDRPAHIAHKRHVYLAAGTQVVMVVDPLRRLVTLYDVDGAEQHCSEHEVLQHHRLPRLSLPLGPIFARIDPPRLVD